MTITVHIPSTLRAWCGDPRKEFELTADSVGEALQQLKADTPDLYGSICDETGAVRPHINLFVNNVLVSIRGNRVVPLESGDDLFILTSVSGG